LVSEDKPNALKITMRITFQMKFDKIKIVNKYHNNTPRIKRWRIKPESCESWTIVSLQNSRGNLCPGEKLSI